VLEDALWTAVRSLEERSALLRRMRDRAGGADRRRSSERFEREAQALTDRAATVRSALVNLRGSVLDSAEATIDSTHEQGEAIT
jgi:hypothetical protein